MKLYPFLVVAIPIAFALPVRADVTITIAEHPDYEMVIVSYAGSIDTTGLSLGGPPVVYTGTVAPDSGEITFCEPIATGVMLPIIVGAVPVAFDLGSAGASACDYFEGDYFFVDGTTIGLPLGYASLSQISGMMVFDNETIASLNFDKSSSPYQATLTTGDILRIEIKDLVDGGALAAVQSTATSKENILLKRIKKLNRKLRAAKRKARR